MDSLAEYADHEREALDGLQRIVEDEVGCPLVRESGIVVGGKDAFLWLQLSTLDIRVIAQTRENKLEVNFRLLDTARWKVGRDTFLETQLDDLARQLFGRGLSRDEDWLEEFSLDEFSALMHEARALGVFHGRLAVN